MKQLCYLAERYQIFSDFYFGFDCLFLINLVISLQDSDFCQAIKMNSHFMFHQLCCMGAKLGLSLSGSNID
jgi:hypothetical protein